MIEVKPTGQACGAMVPGLDLAGELDEATVRYPSYTYPLMKLLDPGR